MAVGIVAIVAGIAGNAHNVKMRAEQRMAMIARGMSVDDIDRLLGKSEDDNRPVRDPLRSLANARRTAIVLISIGIGLIGFFLLLTWILGVHNVLAGAAAGVIPFAIGVGFLIDYNLQKRELSRFGLETGTDLPMHER
ncbi:DUF6249 domain-containing protein [Terriglobus saanensis]|nr:DUF6249 domain-containing protein [Terriglobus saanensis]